MGAGTRSKSSRDKVRAHRKRLHQQGLRPIQIWVPDMRPPAFVSEAHAVIVQDDRFDRTDSVTVCAFTTDPTDAPLFHLPIEPSQSNGLRAVCRLMVDKITTVPKTKIGTRIGRLADEDMVRLNLAVLVFLGIAAPPSEPSESR